MTVVTKENIKVALKELGIVHGDIVLIHSSMKSMGHVEGGPETVIQAVLETVGDEGTLCMPTMVQRDFGNAYKNWDINKSPSDVGYLTEYFRTREGSLRSDQATHAVSAIGKMAEYITSEHTAYGPRLGEFGDYAFSKSSPWQRLYELNAKMLFIGVPMKKGTIRHLAEHIIVEKLIEKFPEATPEVRQYNEPLDKFWAEIDGDKVQVKYEETGLLTKTTIGDATVLCASATPFVDEMIKLSIQSPLDYMGGMATNHPKFIDCIKQL